MRIIERVNQRAIINYFDCEMVIGKRYNYLVTNPNGEVISCMSKPELMEKSWFITGPSEKCYVVDLQDIDWKKTLIHIIH